MSTKELLARTVFYKVGHHGSGNATLRAGLEAMTSEDLVAAMPTDERFAREVKGWEMPAPKLWKALGEKTKGRILRAESGTRCHPYAEAGEHQPGGMGSFPSSCHTRSAVCRLRAVTGGRHGPEPTYPYPTSSQSLSGCLRSLGRLFFPLSKGV